MLTITIIMKKGERREGTILFSHSTALVAMIIIIGRGVNGLIAPFPIPCPEVYVSMLKLN